MTKTNLINSSIVGANNEILLNGAQMTVAVDKLWCAIVMTALKNNEKYFIFDLDSMNLSNVC